MALPKVWLVTPKSHLPHQRLARNHENETRAHMGCPMHNIVGADETVRRGLARDSVKSGLACGGSTIMTGILKLT